MISVEVDHCMISETLWTDSSEGYSLHVIVSGKGIRQVQEEAYLLGAGNFFLCGPCSAGEFLALEETRSVQIHFTQETFEALRFNEDLPVVWDLPQEVLPETEHLLERLASEEEQMRSGGLIAKLGALSELLLAAIREGKKITQKQHRLAESFLFIRDNYARDITLHDLAAVAGVSVSHFRRLFQEEFKISPIDHLVNYRLEKAARKLRSSSESIARIAVECGFGDPNYFSRAFSARYKCSPRAWRKNQSGVSA